VVANDEDDRLRVYDVARGGEPTQTLDPFRAVPRPDGDREADLEGVAIIDRTAWWIGSHARARDGDKRPNRRVLVATRLGVEDGRVTMELVGAHHSSRRRGLLGALLSLPTIGPLLARAERRPPKVEGGFDIEGLASRGDTLLLGLRNPLLDGRAIVVGVPRPAALLEGKEPEGLTWQAIDLGGLGIRALVTMPGRDGLLIAAGASTDGDDFVLYHWNGEPTEAPHRLEVSFGGLRVESILGLPDGRLLAVSDDGSLERGRGRCKDLPLHERAFRARGIALP
jgi:hypothetical protein